jgi:hypothetical protein
LCVKLGCRWSCAYLLSVFSLGYCDLIALPLGVVSVRGEIVQRVNVWEGSRPAVLRIVVSDGAQTGVRVQEGLHAATNILRAEISASAWLIIA